MTHLQHRTGFAVVLIAMAGLMSCELPKSEAEDVDLCAVSEGTSNVAGRWVIAARGDRNACSNEDFNGDFSLDTAQGLTVRQMDDGLGNDTQAFSLDAPINFPGGTFTLEGTVRGTCVDFEAREVRAGGETLSYTFNGRVESGGRISGDFVGTGPVDCTSDGSFTVRLD